MRKLTLAVVPLAMNILTSAQAADLIAPPLSLERETAFGDICRPPPWYRGWPRSCAANLCGGRATIIT